MVCPGIYHLEKKIDHVEKRVDRIDRKVDILKSDMKYLKWMIGILMGGIVALILKAFFSI